MDRGLFVNSVETIHTVSGSGEIWIWVTVSNIIFLRKPVEISLDAASLIIERPFPYLVLVEHGF